MNRHVDRIAFVGVLAAIVALASPTHAALTSVAVNKCLAGKLKLAGKGAAAGTSCRAKHAAKPDAVKLASCLSKASDKVANGFAKLDGKYPGGCPGGNGDGVGRASDAGAFSLQVAADAGGATGKCDGPKQKCVGKYVAAVLGCYAKAANKGGVVDGQCVTKAAGKLADGVKGCLDKAAAAGGCSHPGNQQALLAGGADTFADAQGCVLNPGAGGCTVPGCPAKVEFSPDGSAAATRSDLGWNWIGHDKPFVTGGTVTVAITGLSGSDCVFAGPVANVDADAGAIDNQRCTGNTAVQCTNAPGGTGGPCTGLGTCEFQWGPPMSIYVGGAGVCVQDRIVGAVTGTVNPVSGAVERNLTIERSTWVQPSDAPCPRCIGDLTANDGVPGGTCESGARMNLGCDGNGSVVGWPDSGTTSLDCPPGGFPTTVAQHSMAGTTGTSSVTIQPGSPTCTAVGYTAKRCACEICNNATRGACNANADCPPNDGQPGVCGGYACFGGADDGLPCRTCYGGANAGGYCTSGASCPGGTCTRTSCAAGGSCIKPGQPTQPNSCLDDTATPFVDETNCVDTGVVGDHHGTCVAGPVIGLCDPSSGHPQRECDDDGDCCDDAPGCFTDPVVPGECSGLKVASCYLDNGVVGNSITAEGLADPPSGTIASPTIAQVFCAPPTVTPAINIVYGLPGVMRLELAEHMRLRP